MWGAKQLAVNHAGKGNVVGEASLPGHFGAGVHAAARMADHAKMAVVPV
jgi:hypothetical protein